VKLGGSARSVSEMGAYGKKVTSAPKATVAPSVDAFEDYASSTDA
jgi:hypothetical protein